MPPRRERAEVLLTGATGFLGKVVLYELLRRREELGVERIHLAIRPTRRSAPAERFRAEIAASPGLAGLPAGWEELVRVAACELAEPDAGFAPATRRELAARVSHVVHCAASVEFDLPLREATAANVTSALNVLELARECPRLASLVAVSTAYVTPHPGGDGSVDERPAPLPAPARDIYASILGGAQDEAWLLAKTGHPNTYTLTKCLAEHLLVERGGGLPLSLVRPSIISASWRRPFPGWIDSAAAFALFILSIATGRMRAVVADPRARIDLIPCDAVAERVVGAAFDATPGDRPAIRHAVAGFERSTPPALCRDRIHAFFERNPAGAAARLHYLGPDGLRYRVHHWRHHLRRPDARIVAPRIEQTNRVFAYFTSHTFRFRSSVPFDEPAFDPGRYVDTVCRGVARHLLDADETEVSLAGRRHPRAVGDMRWAISQPGGATTIRFGAWAVSKVLRRCAERVTFDWRSFEEALATAPTNTPRVLVPTHRSYLDFVLLSYLAFARPDLGMGIPHVGAAEEFLRLPLLGALFRRLNAFTVRRGRGEEDKELSRRVHELIRAGHTIECFVEGRRSRSRRMLPPRRGLLRSLQATGQAVALLPVSISYERVPEEEAFAAELAGDPATAMQVRDLAQWTLRALRGGVNLGHIHVACGRPVRLDLASDVRATSRAVMAELQMRTAVTGWHLRAFLAKAREALEDVDLLWLREAIAERGGRVLASRRPLAPAPTVLEPCLRAQFEHVFYPEARVLFADDPAIEGHLRRYDYVGATREPRALEDPRLRRLVHALFEPLRREPGRAI